MVILRWFQKFGLQHSQELETCQFHLPPEGRQCFRKPQRNPQSFNSFVSLNAEKGNLWTDGCGTWMYLVNNPTKAPLETSWTSFPSRMSFHLTLHFTYLSSFFLLDPSSRAMGQARGVFISSPSGTVSAKSAQVEIQPHPSNGRNGRNGRSP